MDRKIRVGAVSYLNTKPFIYGLSRPEAAERVALTLDYPANLVKMLSSGQIDVGLVPVGALPLLKNHQILSEYGIATSGTVASVAVFSEVPMEQIENIILDYQSRTSVLLCRLLFKEHWKKKVRFIEAKDESYLDQIGGNTAGLIIGDRALMNRSRFAHIFDLGEGWKEMTGLPFVFAVWVAGQSWDKNDEPFFSNAIASGLEKIDEIADNHQVGFYDLRHYFMQNIQFKLDEKMKQSIELFLEKVEQLAI